MLSHCSRAPARLMVLHHEPSAARLCQSPLWALDVSNRASWATVSAGRLCSYPDHGNLSEDNNCHSATEVVVVVDSRPGPPCLGGGAGVQRPK